MIPLLVPEISPCDSFCDEDEERRGIGYSSSWIYGTVEKGSRQQVGTPVPAAAAVIYHLIRSALVEKIYISGDQIYIHISPLQLIIIYHRILSALVQIC